MIAGRYSLDREIGRGGMGSVWLGRDEVLGRQVALKRIGLLPGADSTDLARAEREARLSARLNHPHVVSVFDVVDADDDARWLVMEYVEGQTIAQLVRSRGWLSPDEAAPLLWQAADALAAAHAAGIVHRDVKPSNILVDDTGRVKLTDFGIARVTADPSLTQTGLLTGSPAYLAPEVAKGERGAEASDVWSLGATAFHLLAGRPPYETGEHVLSTLYRIVNEDPPRLTEAGWMAPLLDATLVRDVSQRWSMAQVRDYLGAAGRVAPPAVAPPVTAPVAEPAKAPISGVDRDDEPTTVSRPATPRRRRSRMPALLGLLALLLVLGGVGLYLGLSGDDEPTAGTAEPRASETPQPSQQPSPTTQDRPTSAGMEAFIRDYVATVAEDPDASWMMLTPKFQTESGGIKTYRAWWGPATNGRVLSISTNPDDLSVSYQVRFDNYPNGPGPTVLDLRYENGKYLIDGERTQGFQPAGS